MNLSVSFRHADSSHAVVSMIERRARSLDRLDPECRLRAVCCHDGPTADVELVGKIRGRRLVAHASDEDMYRAADLAFDKLSAQAARVHDRNAHAHRRAREEEV